MKKGRRKREKVGLPKKLHASQQLLTHIQTCAHTHTPDLRFTLNTQRKRQVFLFTSRWTSLSVSLPLSHLTVTSAVLSLLCLARPPSLSRIQIIASSYSPPGNEHNNKVTSYPHMSYLFALIPPPLIGFTPSRRLFSSPLLLFFFCLFLLATR